VDLRPALRQERSFHNAHSIFVTLLLALPFYANDESPKNGVNCLIMGWTANPLEELALDLIFESYGEDRYNRTASEYEHLASMLGNLKELHFRVNQRLKEYKVAGRPRWKEICRFKARDLKPLYTPFPESISTQTIRSALNNSGFRQPKWRKRAT